MNKYKCLSCRKSFTEPKEIFRFFPHQGMILKAFGCPFCDSTSYEEKKCFINFIKIKRRLKNEQKF